MSNRPNHRARHRHGRPSRGPSPAAIALIDQAEAASRHAAGVLHEMAQEAAGSVEDGVAGPITRAVAERMRTAMLTHVVAGHPSVCDHLSFRAPTVAHWAAWSPELVRCPDCAAADGDRLRGTVDDFRCDACGTIGDRVHPCVVHLPPFVVDGIPPGQASSLPAVLLSLGLCPTCFDADRRQEALT